MASQLAESAPLKPEVLPGPDPPPLVDNSLSAALRAVRLNGPDDEAARKHARQQRFAADKTNILELSKPKQSLKDARSVGGYGTNQSLEKEYLRLTSQPSAASVRPPDVLRRALQHVQNRWHEERNYEWTSNQLKAIRQDLTVQHCRDALAVATYEMHARLALERDDVAEFRQCNGVLRLLYEEGQEGSAAEFAAYSIIFASSRGRQLLQEELLYAMQADLLEHPHVQHALRVCNAFRNGNITAFLALLDKAPCLSSLLMTQLLPALRVRLLRISMLAYGPTCLPVSFLSRQLGMLGTSQAMQYCREQGLVVVQDGDSVDCRASRLARANTGTT